MIPPSTSSGGYAIRFSDSLASDLTSNALVAWRPGAELQHCRSHDDDMYVEEPMTGTSSYPIVTRDWIQMRRGSERCENNHLEIEHHEIGLRQVMQLGKWKSDNGRH